MSFVKDFSTGIKAYGQALNFIVKNKLSKYFAVPILINILLFFGGMSFINSIVDVLQELIFNQLDELLGKLSWVNYLKQLIHVLIWILFKIIYVMLFAFFGGFVVLVLMSPLLAYLSEKTENILTGKEYSFRLNQFIRDILRGIYLAFRNFIIEMIYLVLFFILGFVPIVNLIAPFGLFIISSYYYGFSFMDYTNERKKRSVGESIQFVKRHKGVAVANGFLFSMFLVIPYIGVFMASIVSVVSVVAATLASLQTTDRTLSLK